MNSDHARHVYPPSTAVPVTRALFSNDTYPWVSLPGEARVMMISKVYMDCRPERRLSDPAERESEAAFEGPRECLKLPCCIREFS